MARLLLRDLTPGTNYKVQLRAVEGDSVSEWSRLFDLISTSDAIAPDVPAWAVSNDWVVSGETFVANWQAVNTTLEQNKDFDFYEVELSDGTTTRIVNTTNTSYTVTFETNRSMFTTPKATVLARVRAVDNVGNRSAWSSQKSATNPAPAAPATITATAATDGVGLKWDASVDNDVVSYKVHMGTTAGFTPTAGNRIYSGDSLEFNYVTLSYSTDHWFKVYAVDVFGQASTVPTATSAAVRPVSPFIIDTTPPATPTSLAATITNNASGIGARAAVSWVMASPPSDLAGYYVRYRKVGDTNYTNAVFQKDDLAGIIELQSAYQNYEFQIKAFDWQNNESAWSSIVTATSPANAVPANVTGLVSTPGKDSITYSWTPVADTDIKNYEVTFSTSATFASGNITYLNGTSTTLTVGGLVAGTTYYARVRAVDNAGNVSAAWSSTDTETTGTFPTAAPSDGQVPGTGTTPNVTGGLSYLYVTWAPVTQNVLGAAQVDTVTYEVHLSTSTGFTPSGATKVTEISGTSAIIDNLPGTTTPLSYGTPYFIKIVPKDRDGSGTASAQGTGTISKVASTDVVSIGADLIVPGTGFVNALVINSGGSIQSSDWSSLTAGWKIGQLGIEINSNASKIKVEALQAGVIGGAPGAGLIDVAAGTSLRLNGGHLRSNTYTYPGQSGSTYVFNSSATAGFYLGNDGLVIAQGTVKAEAFAGGTFTAGTINIGAGGAVTGGSWSLSNAGLSIPNGGILASKLMIQNSANILKPQHADFEFNPLALSSFVASSNATVSIETAAANVKYNTQSLKIVGAGSGWVWLGTSNNDWNEFPVEPNKSYIVSFWAMIPNGGTAQNVVPTVRYSIPSSSADAAGTSQSIPANGTWTRYYTTVTIGATATGTAALWFTTGAGTMYFDGIQVEEKEAYSDVPSAWKPPASTSIDGGMVRTGEIRSTNTNLINGVNEPVWSIPLSGAATFSAMRVLGNTVIGNATNDTSSVLQSANYAPGQTGWQLRADGTADLLGVGANAISVSTLMSRDTDALGAPIVLGNSGSLIARNVSTGAVVGISGTEGFFVRGPIPSGADKGPVYISFPILPDANGNTAPNIISGVLTATTLSVSGDALGNAATFFKNNYLELNSSLTLRNQNAPSISAPTVNNTYVYTAVRPTTNYTLVTPLVGTAGQQYFGIVNSGSSYLINNFVGGYLDTSITLTGLPTTRGSYSVGSRSFKSVTKIGTSYYALGSEVHAIGADVYGAAYLYSFNSAGAYQSSAQMSFAPGSGAGSVWTSTRALGTDGTNLLLATGSASSAITVQAYTTALAATGGLISTGTTPAGNVSGIIGTAADFGASKLVVSTNAANDNVYVFSTTGVYDADLTFPAGKYGLMGITWSAYDGSLVGTSASSVSEVNSIASIRYSQITWTNATTTRWGVATTRYESSGNYESTISPITYFTGVKRAWFQVTADAGTNSSQRVYFGRKSSGDLASTELWRQSMALGSGIASYTYSTAALTGSNPGAGSNPFPSVPTGSARVSSQESDILSVAVSLTTSSTTVTATSGTPFTQAMVGTSITGTGIPAGTTITSINSSTSLVMSAAATTGGFITATITRPLIDLRGSGFTRIREIYSDQALFASNVVADATAGNKPALRIGNAYGQHLRVSDDRLVAMTNDTTQGLLYLNYGGETRSTMMVLESTTDASASAGNKPALRIGSTTGTHLRIDNNEIIAMLGDTGQGTLFLNQGGDVQLGMSGGRVKLAGGDYISGYSRGNTTKTTDSNGDVQIPHGLTGAPLVATVSAGTAHQLMVQALGTTNISVRCRSAAGVLLGAGVTVQVFWTAWQ